MEIPPHSERRQSFTQYCSDELLRWVTYGFKAVKAVTLNVKKHFQETHKQRQEYALSLFSKVNKLYEDRVCTYGLKSSS